MGLLGQIGAEIGFLAKGWGWIKMPLLVLVAPQGVALIGLLAVMEGAEPGQIGNRRRAGFGEGNQMVDLQKSAGPAPGYDTTGIPVLKGGEARAIDRPGEVENF